MGHFEEGSPRSIRDLLQDAPCNWGRWGSEDEVGAVNLLDQTEVLRAVGSVRRGDVFTLGLPIGTEKGDLVWPGRIPTQHYMVRDHSHYANGKVAVDPQYGGSQFADDVVHMYVQGTTQIDALGHVWYDDTLYNGYDAATTVGGLSKDSVVPVAEHGIVGSAVLLDVPRALHREQLMAGEEITLAQLDQVLAVQREAIQPHDIVIVRTGFYRDVWEKGTQGLPVQEVDEPGITYSKEIADWFTQHDIPVFGTDTMDNEQTFSRRLGLCQPMHPFLINRLGVSMLEMLWLEELARACAQDGSYRFCLVVAPLKFVQATGSPINPIAIR
ncbi:MAG: metal-dependent hydrolase [Sulfobacillus acidophilus]|uniref:Metal-dependent hydrolase n=1 Tax=Sulfobacillus acidophilus TaxID=53633 RepID=A0A2T2WDV5_9FIRM|nr:MAG: metal-dependent hydrolase [Sulfobacillus acidophilus]